MKQKVVFLMSIMFMAFVVVGCSSDDVDDDINDPVNSKYLYSDDNYQVDFFLTNISGEETAIFKYGENIVFNLIILNKTNEQVLIEGGVTQLLGNNVFRVYSKDGKDIGVSWEYGDIETVMFYLFPHQERQWSCPWMSDVLCYPSKPFVMKEGVKLLSKGTYYSTFDIRIDETTIISCKISFKII